MTDEPEILDADAPKQVTALVPYRAPQVPAVVGSLGDLESFIRAADQAPMLSPEE